jgi:ABC-type uncharacterized transport system permease subunit
MSNDPVAFATAIVAVSPFVVAGAAGRLEASWSVWLLLGAAVVGGSLPAAMEFATGWSLGLGANLNVSAATILIVFAATAIMNRAALKLAPLVGGYAIALLVCGQIAGRFEPTEGTIHSPSAWFSGHVLLAMASYGALSLAAIAACSVLILERDLKTKSVSWASGSLPPLIAADGIQNALLRLSAIFMFLALATGAANEYMTTGRFLAFTHKILLSFLSFLVLCLLLYMHHRSGMRGRLAARWVLVGFALLTLAYPGVKFIREFMIG